MCFAVVMCVYKIIIITNWSSVKRLRRFCFYCSPVSKSCPTLCNPMDYSKPGYPVLHYLLEFAQTHVQWVSDASNHLILCCPLLLLPSIFSSIMVFSNDLALRIRWSKYWTFSFSISPFDEYSGIILFKIAWFDFLAVQGNPQESSPAPQFENFSSSVLSLLYGSALTSIPNYWKDYSFDYTELCWQSDVSAF